MGGFRCSILSKYFTRGFSFCLVPVLLTGCIFSSGDSNGGGSGAGATPTPSPAQFTQVSTGGGSVCGIRADGVMACWGQLSTTAYTAIPQIVHLGTFYQSVAVGTNGTAPHGCAITTSNLLQCWGDNSDGQLGDGTTISKGAPEIIDSGTNYQSVSVNGSNGTNSGSHTCAITTSGDLKCWGTNYLGNGFYGTRTSPVVIDAGTKYLSVSLGDSYTCGITTNNVLKCWGENSRYGQLGNGNQTDQLYPVVIDAGTPYASVSAFHAMTCGITTAGVLKCWGTGYLGNGNLSTAQTTPVVIDSGVNYQTINNGEGNTCGVTTANTLKCWGDTYGNLTSGTQAPQPLPTQYGNLGDLYAQAVTGPFYGCGITVDGSLQCWGKDDVGQLGNESYSDSSVPVSVSW